MGRREPHLNVILNPDDEPSVGSRRLPPPADLAPLVEWIWTSWWDLRGRPAHVVEILTDTAFHVVFEPGRSNVVGVVTRKFTRRLEGMGRVLGVKFKPGGFRPFTRRRARDFTDKRLPLERALADVDARALEADVLAPADHEGRAARAAAFLRERLPPPDPHVALIQAMVARIDADRELTTVAALARHFDVGTRTLQRLFDDYLGVGPKWVIRRSRLLEAAERLRDGEVTNLAALAAALSYFDQSHLVRDFKAVVGQSPADYRRARTRAVMESER
jgi:AraC-like DNA-binding protein